MSTPQPPTRDPQTEPAWDLYLEIVALQEHKTPANMKHVVSKAQRAVQIAPHVPDLLMLIAVQLYPYHAVDKTAKKLMIQCQVELDRLGGPSEFALAEAGGVESYLHNRNLIASKAGGKVLEMTPAQFAASRTQTAEPAAGWFADPHGQARLRYWDGAAWTGHVSD